MAARRGWRSIPTNLKRNKSTTKSLFVIKIRHFLFNDHYIQFYIVLKLTKVAATLTRVDLYINCIYIFNLRSGPIITVSIHSLLRGPFPQNFICQAKRK